MDIWQIVAEFGWELNLEPDANYLIVSEGENDALTQIV